MEGASETESERHFVWETVTEGGETTKREFWVDSTGRPVRGLTTVTKSSAAVASAATSTPSLAMVIERTEETYSGFGEPNVIVAPPQTAVFSPTSDAHIRPVLAPTGACGTAGLWDCLDEAEPDWDGSLVYLFANSALRVGFTVGSGDVSGSPVEVRFEIALKAQSGTVDAGAYGFTVYSGSDAVATVSGAQELGSEEWTTLTVSDASILSGLSSGLSGVAFQVNAPTSGPRLEWSWVRMVVDYRPTGS